MTASTDTDSLIASLAPRRHHSTVSPVAAAAQSTVDAVVSSAVADADDDDDVADLGRAELDYVHRILQVAERGTLGALAALSAAAMLAAKYGGGLPVHPFALAMWSMGAAITAVTMAALATTPDHRSGNRQVLGTALLLGLICCSTGVVAAADGVAGPSWVIFIPLVAVVGAVVGPVSGLLTGALASAGIYLAAGLTNTLSVAGIGRLVILLPAFPALGIASGALCSAAHRAARDARRQRAILTRDIAALAGLLDAVAEGDLSQTASMPDWSDPATEGLAVVLADTLVALRRLVSGLAAASGQLAGAADEIAQSATTHVEAVEMQAVAVTETTSTIEQLAATATGIAEISARVSGTAAQSRVDAEAGSAAVAASVQAAHGLEMRVDGLLASAGKLRVLVDRIDSSVRVMDESARRTTMLALSAAIEAAAAGEHSAGFTTVAREVRALAEKARESSAAISVIVNQLRGEVSATAAAARQGSTAVAWGLAKQADVERGLDEIAHMIGSTAAAAAEINDATRQQRVAADAVVSAMTSVTESSLHSRRTTARHSESAAELRDLAHEVQASVGRFKLPIRHGSRVIR